MKPPPRIYKYEPFNAQSLQSLKSQIIYFGSPRGFNDPYDCSLFPSIEPLSDEETEQLRIHFLNRPALQPQQALGFRTLPTNELREVLIKAAQSVLQEFAQKFLEEKGVTCFSERPDHLLMWSHYAGRAQGFCLEFDTAHEPFNQRLHKVSYPETIPSIKATSDLYRLGNESSLIEKLFCTKSRDWAYEQEWRAIHHNKNTSYGYPAQSLTGVYFGTESTRASREIICLIIQGQNKNVRFYQGVRSTTEFKVEFSEIHYTSHREAKEKGLIP